MTSVNDDDLTILLLLKGRPAFTARWMAYADRVRCPFRVYVADGSLDEATRDMLANDVFPHVRYEYMRYPPDIRYTDFYAKIADALARIQTPYVAIGENDDFFVTPGVREALAFLDGNPNFETCGGQWAAFWLCNPLYGSPVWKASCDALAIAEETAAARLRRLARWFGTPTYYHVRRTKGLRRIFEIVCRTNLQDIFLNEEMVAFLTAIDGRSRQLPSLYIARQANPPESAGDTHRAARGDALGRMLQPNWSDDFGRFVQATSAALSEADGMPLDAARQAVIAAHRAASAPALLYDVASEPTVTVPRSVALCAANRLLALPAGSRRRRMARAIYRAARWISPDVVHGTQLRGRSIRGARALLEPIWRFLARQRSHTPPAPDCGKP